MRKTEIQKCITWVVLVITIVALLILVLVAINVSGIFRNLKKEDETREEKEKIMLSTSEAYLVGAGIITKKNLENGLNSNFGAGKYSLESLNAECFKITIAETRREYKIYENGKIEVILGDIGGE